MNNFVRRRRPMGRKVERSLAPPRQRTVAPIAAVANIVLGLATILFIAACCQGRCMEWDAKLPQPRRLALLVGITNYQADDPAHPARRADRMPNLDGAEDALLLKKVLINAPWSLATNDILLLPDAKAKRADIIAGFDEMANVRAQKNDAILVYLGGHGMEVPDDDGDELDGLDQAFVPWDYVSSRALDNANVVLRDDEIGKKLDALRKAVGPRGSVTVVLDWCHSGTGTRALKTPRGRGWVEERDGQRPPSNPNGRPRGPSGIFPLGQPETDGFAVIAAAAAMEEALPADFSRYGTLFSDGNHGALTGAVAVALGERGVGTTYYELYDRISAIVAERIGASQHVQLEGIAEDRPFMGRASARTAHHLVMKRGALDDGRGIELPAGEAHGVTLGSRFGLFRPCATNRANKLAEFEIDDVQPFSSRGHILAPFLSKLDRNAIPGAWAVELSHRFESQKLAVYFDGNGSMRATLQELRFVDLSTTLDPQHLPDLSLSLERGKWVIKRPDGVSGLGDIPDDANAPESIKQILLAQWRWAYLARLQSPQTASLPPPIVRIVPASPTHGEIGAAHLHNAFVENSLVNIEVQMPPSSATADGFVWISLLQLAPDGSITALYPAPNDVSGNRLSADDKLHTLRLLLDPTESPRNYEFQVITPGRYFLKAIATNAPVDFTGIVSASTGRIRDLAVARAPTEFSALAILWSAAADQTVSTMRVPVTTWSTSQIAFDVVPAGQYH